MVQRTVTVFHQCVASQGEHTEQQQQLRDEAQRLIDSNSFNSILSIFNAHLLNSPEFNAEKLVLKDQQET